MKINFSDIAKYKIQIIDYVNDGIFKFKINMPDIYNERWLKYKEQIDKNDSVVLKCLNNELAFKNYDRIGTRDKVMEINFDHCFKANYYFSNGQKIVSVKESDGKFEMGVHKSNQTFCDWFFPHPNFITFSLESCFIKSFETIEKLESEVINVLSDIQVHKIALEYDSNLDYLEIQKVHLSDYILRYGGYQNQLELKYEGPTFDIEFKEFLKQIKPRKAICCIECKHFHFSGMSHDMSAGHTGYCKVMEAKLSKPNISQSITNITNSCSKFERIVE